MIEDQQQTEQITITEGVHFIGNPCNKCGESVRYIKDKRCVFCKKNYNKQWHGDNLKYCREYRQQKCIENKKELKNSIHFTGEVCHKCGSDIKYSRDKSCVLCHNNYRKQRYQENKEHELKINAKWRYDNPEYYKDRSEYNKQWKKQNPEKTTAIHQNRRAREQNAEGNFTDREWAELCNQYGNKCLCCLRDNVKLTPDHITPLAKGGTNYIENIQPLCVSCNCKKYTKIIDYRNPENHNLTKI